MRNLLQQCIRYLVILSFAAFEKLLTSRKLKKFSALSAKYSVSAGSKLELDVT